MSAFTTSLSRRPRIIPALAAALDRSPGAGFSNSAGVDDCLMLVQAVVKH